jgi:pimeloyl-ACP methyl ester carboxylesterase
LKTITVPGLVLQGDDDQVVPYKNAALLQDKLLANSVLKIYPGFPHGMHTTHADTINAGYSCRLYLLTYAVTLNCQCKGGVVYSA